MILQNTYIESEGNAHTCTCAYKAGYLYMHVFHVNDGLIELQMIIIEARTLALAEKQTGAGCADNTQGTSNN